MALRFGMLSHPRSRLRHISLCHSSCKASLVPSACALAKRRQPLVVMRNAIGISLYEKYKNRNYMLSSFS
ncbi:hypothetical protein EHQ81_13515 [Leptospira selangorensis]|uniref:Uncharacterized protein n=1 Tax=Leptospira selangorensis TaxID=2484982 RepID=A0A5F2C154_9LEPT|nr:hypothetical protein EHQ81_13515 [Leptospira selangorensis]TGM20177.1 hypothetical protein EHQ82_10880 [Leptospira selangorensis]